MRTDRAEGVIAVFDGKKDDAVVASGSLSVFWPPFGSLISSSVIA